MIEPTNYLLEIARGKAQMTFFVDVGYLIALEKWKEKFPQLSEDLRAVKQQITQILEEKHSVQLHIHPHWENVKFENGAWNINVDGCYKLSDFTLEESADIVRKYKYYLDELLGYSTTVFRAGGWCIQPFDRLQAVFEELKLEIDSSVMPGMKYFTEHYSYDFSAVRSSDPYTFSSDICEEDVHGKMTEYPIATMQYSPIFYWFLYGWGRLIPSKHKVVGNGTAVAQPGRKWEVLTRRTLHHVSADGYFALKLPLATRKFAREGKQHLVIIGHPKSLTQFSSKKLKNYIAKYSSTHQFISLNNANR